MTGPLVLPGDPTTPNQAADKHYIDMNIAAAAGEWGRRFRCCLLRHRR